MMTLKQQVIIFENEEEYYRFNDFYKIISVRKLPDGRYEVIYI